MLLPKVYTVFLAGMHGRLAVHPQLVHGVATLPLPQSQLAFSMGTCRIQERRADCQDALASGPARCGGPPLPP